MFSIKSCECQKNHGDTNAKDSLAIQQPYGLVENIPNVDNLAFCAHCVKPRISKEEAKT